MSSVLLDYVFPIELVDQIPELDAGFLKRVAVVVKPKSGITSSFERVISKTAIQAFTDNTEVSRLFDAGMNEVFLILSDDLVLGEILRQQKGKFYTLLISSDYDSSEIEGVRATLVSQGLTYTSKVLGEAGNNITLTIVGGATDGGAIVSVDGANIQIQIEDEVTTSLTVQQAIIASLPASALVSVSGGDATALEVSPIANLTGGGNAIDLTDFDGVTGVSGSDLDFLEAQNLIVNRTGFYGSAINGAQSMMFAFGELLSSFNWGNKQYVEMPISDGVEELAVANDLFNKRISFVLADERYLNRLAMFAVGGRAIVAPYIIKNLNIEMQYRALNWIQENEPSYTLKEASLLETRIQEDVINNFIVRNLIVSGSISITLQQDNFVASGAINVPTPKALWRVVNRMVQTN